MKKSLLFIILAVAILQLNAQTGGTSINTTGAAPDPSAMLDISGTSKGVLINRMTQTERDAIVNPAMGLQLFNTTTHCFNFWMGATWKQICGDCDFNSPVAGNNGPICESSTLNLSATSIAGATYQWSGPNGFTSTLQNPSIVNATAGASGSYSVSATLNGCTSQLQSTVATVNATPVTPSAGNNGPVCVGDQIVLNAAAITGASYSWTGPNGYSANVQNPVINGAQLNNAGSYSVTASVNGCLSSSGSTSVSINSIPAVPGTITGANSICPSTTGNVYSIVPVAGATSYNWSVPGGATITANSGTSVTVTFGINPVGTLSVSATNVCGTSSTSSISITENNVCSPMILNATGSGASGTIQTFTVPEGVTTLTIEVFGAQGGLNTKTNVVGGKGAKMKGTFVVTPGEQFKVLVGQAGATNYGRPSGGGGTFVATMADIPLIIAGGGGGVGEGGGSAANADASITTTGNGGMGGSVGSGGTSGNGGNAGRLTPGGGGFYTDGAPSNSDGGQSIAGAGKSFLNGGEGGASASVIAGCYGGGDFWSSSPGGFGGGAGAGYAACSPGGGYSGGGGADGCHPGTGGGGGSYNSGSGQANASGIQSGNGQAIFSW